MTESEVRKLLRHFPQVRRAPARCWLPPQSHLSKDTKKTAETTAEQSGYSAEGREK